MKEKELIKIVNDIIALSVDDERAHSEEDSLHLKVIREFCPEWVVKQIDRLEKADFQRWCS